MTKTQWKTHQTMPYIGYKLGNDDFSWEYVERIGEIHINGNTLQTEFTIYFTSGNNYVYSYPIHTLDPDYETHTSLFGFKHKVQITDVQHYFRRNCSKLQAITKNREKVVKSFYKYKRNQAKHKHI